MDLSQKIIAAILAGFFLVALIRVFSSLPPGAETTAEHPVGVFSPGGRTADGGLTGIALGLNLWNALVIAVLGLPGFVLLLLLSSDSVALHIVFKRLWQLSPRASKYWSTRRQPMSPPVNRQMVRDGGAGMETDSSRPASTRSRLRRLIHS